MSGTLADVRLDSASLVPWYYQTARALEEAIVDDSRGKASCCWRASWISWSSWGSEPSHHAGGYEVAGGLEGLAHGEARHKDPGHATAREAGGHPDQLVQRPKEAGREPRTRVLALG